MDRLVDQLTDYALNLSYDDLPIEVITRTKKLILDSIGCSFGAYDSLPAVIARKICSSVSCSNPAAVLVGGQSTTPDLAAFANGVMIRYLDYSDVYWNTGVCHPSDMLGPVLAVADSLHLDGKSTILGAVLGYEILCGLVDSEAVRARRGWDQAVYAGIAAAVVAGKLMGLNSAQMKHAISLAASSHLTVGQVRSGEISHWKGCSVANASRNAVFSSLLASEDMTGPGYIFEGPSGVFNATGGRFELLPLGGGQEPYRIMNVRVKPYPSGYPSHTAIEAALTVRSQLPEIDQIEEIRIQAAKGGMGYASDESRWNPETRESADHSLPFTVVLALLEGSVEIRHFEEEYFKTAAIRNLMSKVTAELSEECERAGAQAMMTIVDVKLASGRSFSAKAQFNLLDAESHFSDGNQEAKFVPLAKSLMPVTQIDDLLSRIRNLEHLSDTHEVLTLTIPPLGES